MPLNNYNQSYIPYGYPASGYQNPYYYNPAQFTAGNIPYQNPVQQNPIRQSSSVLQGKTVDSLDVVKATDIPLDFSVSYFPLIDGSAIVTKQLQQDGTSKITIYKPSQEDTKVEPEYATTEDIKRVDAVLDEVNELKDTIKNLKKQVRDLTEDMEDSKRTSKRSK